MKYPYSFEVLNSGDLVMRLPKEIKLVETFLGIEVAAFGDWILEEIHSILNGEKKLCGSKWQHLRFRNSERHNYYIRQFSRIW